MIKYILIAIGAAIATFLFGDNIEKLNYETYKDTLSALLNISAIIFAIIGAWIAIIYPRAIGKAFKSESNETKSENDKKLEENESDADYLSELVEIVLVSAFVLMFVLIIQFSVPVIKPIIAGESTKLLKYSIFYVVFLLTLSQLYAIFRVILANYFFLNKLRKKNIDDKIDSWHD